MPISKLRSGQGSPLPHFRRPWFILHGGSALKSWLCCFFTSYMRQLKIPRIWRRELVVAIPKPEKPLGAPKSYRPVSLLCVPFMFLERLIYARVEPTIDLLLQSEQFMHSYHNKLLPNHFDEYFIPLSSIHYHSTRLATSKNLFLPRVNSSSGKCSLKFIGPKVWSSIPDNIKLSTTFTFKWRNTSYMKKIPNYEL